MASQGTAANSELATLCALLDTLIEVLDAERDQHWSSWMRISRSSIARGDLDGVEHFLGAFGGMGSFNDGASERSLSIAATAYSLARKIRPREDEA